MTTTTASHTPGSQGTYSHRPIVWGTRGMVGGGTQLTAQSGMRILWQGGNAVDAAVASALAAGVMEPTAHYTLGGEVAFLFYDRASRSVRSVVGQGWAPQRATIDHYLENWGEIPPGVLSSTVPGVISALLAMLSDYGTKSFAQVAESALHFAGKGFPAYQLFVRTVATAERMANLRKYPDSARIFLPNDRPPESGFPVFTRRSRPHPVLDGPGRGAGAGRRQYSGGRNPGSSRRLLQGRRGPPHGQGPSGLRRAVRPGGLCRV